MTVDHSQSEQGLTLPKVSICLITYNRAQYLAKVLEHLLAARFSFSYEIIISDNCSTDDTPEIVAAFTQQYAHIRYFRQAKNVGSEGNLITAYRLAAGEYCIYLADDDQLIPEGTNAVIDYMDRHPTVGACHAPWELWDDVAKEADCLFYQVGEERLFAKKDALDLCNFIVSHRVFPEICVFRASILQKMLYMPRKAYSAFVCLINALNESDVAFLPAPYYRSVTKHWAGEQREQAGVQQAMAEWDLYRGGIEYMLHKAFTYLGFPAIPPEQMPAAQQMIESFVADRLVVAVRLLVARKDFIGAYDLFVRLQVHGAFPPNELAAYRQFLNGRAAVQALLMTLQSITSLDTVALYEVEAPEAVQMLLAECGHEGRVEVLPAASSGGTVARERMLVLAGSIDAKQRLMNAGFNPGFIIVETELTRQFTA